MDRKHLIIDFEIQPLLSTTLGEKAVSVPVRQPGGQVTVLEAVRAFESCYGGRKLSILDGDNVRPGMMVMLRDASGSLHRIAAPADQPLRTGEKVVLRTLMAGG